MLLSDQIVSAKGTDLDRLMWSVPGRFAEQILAARRIALTAESRAFAEGIVKKPFQTALLLESIKPQRFQPLWLEWRLPLNGQPVEFSGSKPTVDRLGVLLTADSVFPAVAATVAWNFKNPELHFNISPCAAWLDCSEDGGVFRRGVAEFASLGASTREDVVAAEKFGGGYSLNDAVEIARHYELPRGQKDLAAIRDISTRAVAFPAPVWVPSLGFLGSDRAVISRIMADALADMEGEVGRAWMAAALVNAGALSIVHAELEKINKARARSRKPPLLPHEVADLDWPSLTGRAEAKGMSRDEMRAHLVSGHFKRRESGVFWWRPHVRA